MSNAKICDNCGNIIKDFNIEIEGYKVNKEKKLQYKIKYIKDFCSFNCLAEWSKNEQKIFEEIKTTINKYKVEEDK